LCYNKIAVTLCTLLLLTFSSLLAQSPAVVEKPEDSNQSIYRKIENSAWNIGESLTFSIRYGPVVAGTAIMTVKDTARINNKLCYRIVTEARSNKFLDTFFKVRDTAESFMDYDGLYTLKFEKHIREGKYRRDRSILYDHVNEIAIADKDTMVVPRYVQDVLSTLYFLRTQEYKVGDILSVQNHSDRNVYDLKVRIHGKEGVRVRAGTFKCLLVEPFLVEGGGIFKHEGRILVWITDDERRIPVQMKSKVYIGSVIAELETMEGIR
jgi:hypothetical protein